MAYTQLQILSFTSRVMYLMLLSTKDIGGSFLYGFRVYLDYSPTIVNKHFQ